MSEQTSTDYDLDAYQAVAGHRSRERFEQAFDSAKDSLFTEAQKLSSLDERELRENTSYAIGSSANCNRFRFPYYDVEARYEMYYFGCFRRDNAEHEKGCPAIGNRYDWSYGKSFREEMGRPDPSSQGKECECAKGQELERQQAEQRQVEYERVMAQIAAERAAREAAGQQD